MTRSAVSLLFLLAAMSGVAAAQSTPAAAITPQPATAGQPITLTLEFDEPMAFLPGLRSIERLGTTVRVVYTREELIIGVPPPGPVVFPVALGGFPPGQYTVLVEGVFDFDGSPAPGTTTGFAVQGGPRRVPWDAPWAQALAAFAILILGLLGLRRR